MADILPGSVYRQELRLAAAHDTEHKKYTVVYSDYPSDRTKQCADCRPLCDEQIAQRRRSKPTVACSGIGVQK